MDYPLPARDWQYTGTGWVSRAWTKNAYAAAQANHFKWQRIVVRESEVAQAQKEGWERETRVTDLAA